ncbi:MAG: sulfatase-like hydrolase/transferase, partial [bacterium]|nr:sulfatase-like hydrolase/transferase [bacterium]
AHGKDGGPDRSPNFVVIMADDLGAGELGCYGNTQNRTPRLDRLAHTGFRFRTCWATPLCSPTRVEILTGRYGFRTGWYNFLGRVTTPMDHLDPDEPRFVRDQTVGQMCELARPERDRPGKISDRRVGSQMHHGLDLVARIAPPVLGLHAEAEGLAGPHPGRQDGPPSLGRPGDDADGGLLRQRHIGVGGDGIGEDAELEGLLAEGLHAHAGGAAAGVAEGYGDRVAFLHETLDDLDVEAPVPGPDVQLGIVAHLENG